MKSRHDMVQKAFCTTRQAADLLGVSLRTTQLWAESGVLEAWKTSGGHRRISRASVERLLYKTEIPPPDVAVADGRPGQPELKILVVKDDSTLSRLYAQAISLWPLPSEVTIASNDAEALITIGRKRPDFLIIDLLMPHAMLRVLGSMPESENMAIVVMNSPGAHGMDRPEALPSTVRLFPKPVQFHALFDIAQSIIKVKREKYRRWAGDTGSE